MHRHLTPAIVRQLGTALGLWGYTLDLGLTGKPQEANPDLIAVEESPVYGAILSMIEEQEPPRMVKKEVSGVSVYVDEAPSALYLAMREAMYEAYRQAARSAQG
jgi:hypothetical protein